MSKNETFCLRFEQGYIILMENLAQTGILGQFFEKNHNALNMSVVEEKFGKFQIKECFKD